jgi:hypothetical protein
MKHDFLRHPPFKAPALVPEDMDDLDRLVYYHRRGLWAALGFIIMFGTLSALQVGFPHSHAGGFAIFVAPYLQPLVVLGAGALQIAIRKADVDPLGDAMETMVGDELHKSSVNRAIRNGFFCVMVLQPLLAAAPLFIAVENPVSLMAIVMLTAGAAVTLASVLFYDR